MDPRASLVVLRTWLNRAGGQVPQGALRGVRGSLRGLENKSLKEEDWNILGFREIGCGIHRFEN